MYERFLKESQNRSKNQRKLIKIYTITIVTGLITLYLFIRPIGPMREIGMWALIVQMLFLMCFGYVIAFELSIQKLPVRGSELSNLLEEALDNEKELVRLTCHNIIGKVLAGEELQNTVIFHLENFVNNILDFEEEES